MVHRPRTGLRDCRLLAALLLAALLLITGLAGDLSRAQAARQAPLIPACEASQGLWQGARHAALVVSLGEGQPARTFCIEFAEESISGLELLQRSGLPLVLSSSGVGTAVCSIDGVGSNNPATYNTCFGKYPDYWVYHQYVNGSWRVSPVGPSMSKVRNGSIEGWSWGDNTKPPTPGETCANDPSPAPSPPLKLTTPSPAATPAPTGFPPPTSLAGPAASGTASSAPTIVPTPPTPEPAPFPGINEAVSSPSEAPTRLAGVIAPSAGEAHPSSGQVSAQEGGGLPAGLIAFGGVAGTLIATAGLIYYRRRGIG